MIFYSRAPGSPHWSSEKRVCVTTVTSDQAGNCVTMNGAVNNGRCSGNGVTGSLNTLQLSSYPAFRHRDPGPDSGAAVWCRQSSPSCSVSNRNIKTAKQAKICCTIFCSTQYFAAAAANKQSIHSFELIHIDYRLQQIECSLLNAGHHFSFQHRVNDQLPVCELSAAAAPESPRRLAATGDWRGQSVGDTR